MRLIACLLALLLPMAGHGQPVSVVAAENFYADVARQIGGSAVTVTGILSNPDQDPHLFEASPSVARDLAAARIVVRNGVDYDPWMETLLRAHTAPDRVVITVATLVGRKPGDNPHLWYDPATMPAFARAFTEALDHVDPAHAADHAKQRDAFLASLAPLDRIVTSLRAAHAGTPITATEPVFGYMAGALGLTMRNQAFQLAVMNGSEPSASDVAAFETDLTQHRVRVMLYNKQAADPVVEHLLTLARDVRIPIVAITETEPPGQSYVGWMLGQLHELDEALARP